MPLADPTRCPGCGAPRSAGVECPRCGIIYARARPRVAPPAPTPVPAILDSTPQVPGAVVGGPGDARGLISPDQAPAVWAGDVEDARSELRIRTWAPPAALLLAWLLVASGAGHALVRTFLTMWVHELGHTLAAWFAGYGAFPGPWRTPVSSTRLVLVVVLLAAGLGTLVWWGWRTKRRWALAAGAAGLAAQLVCTLLPARAAQALFTFGGDAGAMVLGSALFATIWSDPQGPLGRGSLRWGFLAIGACALVDPIDTWVRAWGDAGQIPLGEIEGVGLSDASKLWKVHGWALSEISHRYVAVGLVCLAVLGVAYWLAVQGARARLRATEADPERPA